MQNPMRAAEPWRALAVGLSGHNPCKEIPVSTWSRRLAVSTLAGIMAIAGIAMARSQVEPGKQHRQPSDRRPVEGPEYAAWIPPGTYSAIVLNSSGDERRWAVSLMTRSLNVPIVVAPGDNVVIEFREGWKVDRDDEARIISNLVPFANSALYNKVGEQPEYVLSAWGITASGPVQFVYRDVEKK